jgi:integrase
MMRREDIAELHLERHFVSDGKGNFRTLKVTTRKTGARIEVTLSPSLTERLRKHLDIYRPLIERVPTKYLFPGRKGDHMNPATIARQIVTLVKRSIGAQYNVQLVRHMAATMLLEEDPRHKVVAQNLLGHKSEKTTLQYYAQPRTREAHKMYGQILDDKLSAARGRRPRQ